jgi:hypothetical protein
MVAVQYLKGEAIKLRTIAAIVVHSSSEDQLDSDILLPETNESEAYYFD